MMLSMTFMAEILYWPILLLFVYVWLINDQQEGRPELNLQSPFLFAHVTASV